VAAALEIPKAVQERYADELRVGVGVNSGPVMSGTVGGGGRLDFTVIGDVVNTASRVESATRETDDDVLITESTRSLLSSDDGRWEGREVEGLKGKEEEVALFAPVRG
jgi:adenylate cyclase